MKDFVCEDESEVQSWRCCRTVRAKLDYTAGLYIFICGGRQLLLLFPPRYIARVNTALLRTAAHLHHFYLVCTPGHFQHRRCIAMHQRNGQPLSINDLDIVYIPLLCYFLHLFSFSRLQGMELRVEIACSLNSDRLMLSFPFTGERSLLSVILHDIFLS